MQIKIAKQGFPHQENLENLGNRREIVAMKAPSIWSYYSYVRFLNDHFTYRKENDPTINYSAWSREMNFRNLASLTRILSGDRVPGDDTLSLFLDYFGWNKEEREYFTYLVRAEREADTELRELYLSRLDELRSKSSPLLNIKQKMLLLWGTVHEEEFKQYLAPYGFESISTYGATRTAVCLKGAITTESELGSYSEFNFVSYVKRKGRALGEFEVFVDKIYSPVDSVNAAFNKIGVPYEKRDLQHNLNSEKAPFSFSVLDEQKVELKFKMAHTEEPLDFAPQPNDIYGYNPILKSERAFRMKLNSTACSRNFNATQDDFSYDVNSSVGRFLGKIGFSPSYWTYHPDFTALVYPVAPR